MTAPNRNTPAAIIADAYFDAGKLQAGDTPTSEQIAMASSRLIDIINFEQTQGIKLWLNVDTEVTLAEDQGTYVFGPLAAGATVDMTKPLRVIEAYYKDEDDIRRPLVPLSWDDYIRLSQVNQTGQINSYFVNKKQSVLSVFFWLIPDETAATGTAHLLFQVQVTNFTSLTETMNFPIEWRMFLRWALAEELSTGQPSTIMDRCSNMAQRYRDALEGWDVEDVGTQFTPDQRGQYATGNFR